MFSMLRPAVLHSKSALRAALIAALATLSACASYAPPEHVAPVAHAPEITDSQIMLSASIPLSELREALVRLPPDIPAKGTAKLVCTPLPHAEGGGVVMQDTCADVPYCDAKGCGSTRKCVKTPRLVPPSVSLQPSCANYDYSVVIHPDGPPVVSRNGDKLHVEQPLRIEGTGAFSGDLALVLPRDTKHFEVRLAPGADLGFDVSTDWCPAVDLTPTQKWVTSAKVLVLPQSCTTIDLGRLGKHPVCVGPADLDLTGVANANMKGVQDQIGKAIRIALACDKVRGQLESVWKTTPVPLPDLAGAKAWLNLTPHSASLARLRVDDQGVHLSARLGVRTEVSTVPAAPESLALPSLTRLNPDAGGLDLNLRAEASYVTLKAALSQLVVGQTAEAVTPAGRLSARIIDFDLYPTRTSMTVGVKIRTRLPGKLLDDEGWIYLTGEPQVGPDGQTLKIGALRLALVVRNPGVLVLTTLFSGPVIAVLNANANYDLTDTLNKASDQMVAGINATHINGVSLNAGRPAITLKRVAADRDGVLADASIRLPLTATLGHSLIWP